MVPDWILDKADHTHEPEAMRLLVTCWATATTVEEGDIVLRIGWGEHIRLLVARPTAGLWDVCANGVNSLRTGRELVALAEEFARTWRGVDRAAPGDTDRSYEVRQMWRQAITLRERLDEAELLLRQHGYIVYQHR